MPRPTRSMTLPLLLTLGALALSTAAVAAQAPGGGGPNRDPANPWIVGPTGTPNLGRLAEPVLPYRHAPKLQAPAGHEFGNVSGVALTPQGNVIVFNRNPAIMMVEYDKDGRFVRTFNPNIAINTHGLRVDRHGNIWAIDNFMNVVWKLNPKGEPMMMLGTRGELGPWDEAKWNGMFNQPLDIAFDQDDNVYVIQGHGGTAGAQGCSLCGTYANATMKVMQGSDPRVLKFDKDGKYITSRYLGRPTPPFPTVHSVIVTPKGEVWTTDRQGNKVLVHDRNLRLLREIQLPVRTSGLFVDAQNTIWVSSGMDGLILKLDDNGRIAGWFGKAGRDRTDPEQIGEAHYLVVTPDQRTIYIADSVNASVHRLDRN